MVFVRSLFTTMNQFIKNNSYRSNKRNNAPENFGIEKLQAKISSLYGIEKLEEINLLIALLIEQLTDNLELIHKPAPTKRNNCFSLICILSLPIDFPQSAAMPLFLYGDRVCHESKEDYGGYYYSMSSTSYRKNSSLSMEFDD